MRFYDIIAKKRHGLALSGEEIDFFVSEYTAGSIPDYQVSALLMAICTRGMSGEETARLTAAIAASGDRVDLSCFGNLTVDKHSTGGVGDKTTLIVAPLAAALGCKVAKMSGRGLGHTGGTVDKLESFPGYTTSLSSEKFLDTVRRIGVSVVGQSGNLAPADKKIYALRDVTATVDSVPLIASSVMGKKLAAGAHSIVLDVKCGSGSFMKTPLEAEELARAMVDIGRRNGRAVSALITNMDARLGCRQYSRGPRGYRHTARRRSARPSGNLYRPRRRDGASVARHGSRDGALKGGGGACGRRGSCKIQGMDIRPGR